MRGRFSLPCFLLRLLAGVGPALLLLGAELGAQTLYWAWPGDEGERLGRTVARGWDIDQGGRAEVVIANGNQKTKGKVYVVTAHNGHMLFTFEGREVNELYGISAAVIGTVDGDSHPEILIGAAGANGGRGRVEVRSGKTGKILYEVFSPTGKEDRFGHAVADVGGDVDGDGVSDFVVGSPFGKYPGGGYTTGYISVHSGATGAEIMRRSFNAEKDLQHFGWSVAGVGDVNNDGRLDVAAGAPSHDAGTPETDRGVAGVFDALTGQPLGVVVGVAKEDQLGWSVAGVGEVDGDGFDDWMVGAPYGDTGGHTNNGYVQIISGKDASVIHRFEGENKHEHFGTSIGRPGDFNGDGIDDFVCGAPLAMGHVIPQGRVRIYSGRTFAKLFQISPSSYAQHGRFGQEFAAAGDIDQNGTMDLAVGALEALEARGVVEFVLIGEPNW